MMDCFWLGSVFNRTLSLFFSVLSFIAANHSLCAMEQVIDSLYSISFISDVLETQCLKRNKGADKSRYKVIKALNPIIRHLLYRVKRYE